MKLCECRQNWSKFESDLLRRSKKGEILDRSFISMFFMACICSALISAHFFLFSFLCLLVCIRFVSLVRNFKTTKTSVAMKKLVPAIFISVLSLELLDAILMYSYLIGIAISNDKYQVLLFSVLDNLVRCVIFYVLILNMMIFKIFTAPFILCVRCFFTRWKLDF